MLIMSRREGDTIPAGDEIEIVIAHIGRTRLKVGIRAPPRQDGDSARTQADTGTEPRCRTSAGVLRGNPVQPARPAAAAGPRGIKKWKAADERG